MCRLAITDEKYKIMSLIYCLQMTQFSRVLFGKREAFMPPLHLLPYYLITPIFPFCAHCICRVGTRYWDLWASTKAQQNPCSLLVLVPLAHKVTLDRVKQLAVWVGQCGEDGSTPIHITQPALYPLKQAATIRSVKGYIMEGSISSGFGWLLVMNLGEIPFCPLLPKAKRLGLAFTPDGCSPTLSGCATDEESVQKEQ